MKEAKKFIVCLDVTKDSGETLVMPARNGSISDLIEICTGHVPEFTVPEENVESTKETFEALGYDIDFILRTEEELKEIDEFEGF